MRNRAQRGVWWLVVLTGVALSTHALVAQNEDSTTRAVQGTVTDGADKALAKAVVQLKDTKTLQIRSFITEDDGGYHFTGLSPNVEYELKADFDGASSGKKTLSVFNTQKSVTINLKVKK